MLKNPSADIWRLSHAQSLLHAEHREGCDFPMMLTTGPGGIWYGLGNCVLGVAPLNPSGPLLRSYLSWGLTRLCCPWAW